MRRWTALAAFLLVLPVASGSAEGNPPDAAGIKPPVAARKPVQSVAHGIARTDDYAWLRAENWRDVVRDPSLLPPAIREHLEAENKYAGAVHAPLAGLRTKLIAEMKGRIPPADSGVPMPDGPYAYWQKFEAGAEHPQIVRAPRNGGPEEILVDGTVLAAGRSYFSFGDSRRHSPDHRYYAYTIDDTGSELFTLLVRDLASKRDLPDVIKAVQGFAWAGSDTLFYTRLDDDLRARFVYRHRLGTDPAQDALVYEEKDTQFSVGVGRTRNGRFIVISTESSDTSEERIIDASKPDSEPVLVQPPQGRPDRGSTDSQVLADRLLWEMASRGIVTGHDLAAQGVVGGVRARHHSSFTHRGRAGSSPRAEAPP